MNSTPFTRCQLCGQRLSVTPAGKWHQLWLAGPLTPHGRPTVTGFAGYCHRECPEPDEGNKKGAEAP